MGSVFLRAARAVVCIEAAGSVRCVWGARADAGTASRVVKTECGVPAEEHAIGHPFRGIETPKRP